ncbi:MAG TPA: polyketide synthase, partial [Planctomycetes bacterium]|nr:polyketide synthase [Planctomycetota bacterium]
MKPENCPVAIVGLGAIFPGAKDAASYWRNIVGAVDAITDVPASRWDEVFYDPTSSAADRFYCKRGGFVDEFATFDALGFGIMPVAAAGAEPDQLLALQAAQAALKDAGYSDAPFARERTSVIIGRGNYIGAGMTRLEQHVRTSEQLVSALRSLLPDLTDEQLARVKSDFQDNLGHYGADTAIGLVPNLTASRIANRLNLSGSAYTVDAACASSLLAVDHATAELASGQADLVIAGGVHLSHDVAFWSVFCQMGALSRKQQIRPFHEDADGLLIGEGVGMVILKRLADAERDGDRIYAVIQGTGIASDGRQTSLMEPSVDGQLLALERAWQGTGLEPNSVGLIEAHGTATTVGDAAELQTLQRFFGSAAKGETRSVVGSVKSMIGHTMPAAGIAGIIKTALALYHRTLPPTLHCDAPHATMQATRFRVLSEPQSWEDSGLPVVAGVNAFGFGGINAHVVLKAHDAHRAAPQSSPREEILLLAADSPAQLASALQTHSQPSGGACRLALVNPTPQRREKALKAIASGKARRGRDGLWFQTDGLLTQGGKIAFLFPGIEANYQPRVDDVALELGVTLP